MASDTQFHFALADQPLQALPVLEIDGKKYCQGQAIARYLAREFGNYSKIIFWNLIKRVFRSSADICFPFFFLNCTIFKKVKY